MPFFAYIIFFTKLSYFECNDFVKICINFSSQFYFSTSQWRIFVGFLYLFISHLICVCIITHFYYYLQYLFIIIFLRFLLYNVCVHVKYSLIIIICYSMQWLYNRSSALFPSFDTNDKMSESEKIMAVEFQIKEVIRVAKQNSRTIPVYPYIFYKYSDNHNLITQVI